MVSAIPEDDLPVIFGANREELACGLEVDAARDVVAADAFTLVLNCG